MKKTILLIFSLLLIVLVLLGSVYYVKNVKNRTQVDASFSIKLTKSQGLNKLPGNIIPPEFYFQLIVIIEKIV